jgi:DNA-binding NarL/FixJ family response regulator
MDELLSDLIETLDLLNAQAEVYQRTLPGDNYPARAAVSTLGELARQAYRQAQDLQAEGVTGNQPQAHPFSPREREVLQLTAKGLTNKQIAYRLHLSERTVQYHLRSIFNKTNTNSRTRVVALAVQNGWI